MRIIRRTKKKMKSKSKMSSLGISRRKQTLKLLNRIIKLFIKIKRRLHQHYRKIKITKRERKHPKINKSTINPKEMGITKFKNHP